MSWPAPHPARPRCCPLPKPSNSPTQGSKMNPLTRRHLVSGGLRVLGAASAAAALGPLSVLTPARTALAAGAAITTMPLTPKQLGGLTLLQGAGCNVVAMAGPNGALLIDGGLAVNSQG